MKNTLLWETLKTVEQLEVAFEETLQTIDHINTRYSTMSLLTKTAERHQRLYESEIQAAITGTTTSRHKIHSNPKKRNKKRRIKKRNSKKNRTNPKTQVELPVLKLHANCQCQLNVNGSNTQLQTGNEHLEQDYIDGELTSEAPVTSNGWGMSEGLDRIDLNLSACNTDCCPCCQT